MVDSKDRILIVDDEPELLEVLQAWFTGRAFDVDVAGDAIEALSLLRLRPYDVMVTDLRMPGITGLELQSFAKELQPDLSVVFLTGQADMSDAIAALREHRAFDFLTKPLANVHQLHLVVEKALYSRRRAVGTSGFDGPAAPRVVAPVAAARAPQVGPLTSRELEIVGCLANGLANKEISQQLTLSPRTIKNYLSRIYDKLGATNRTQAVMYCQKHGLI